jgi:hypothetical protein
VSSKGRAERRRAEREAAKAAQDGPRDRMHDWWRNVRAEFTSRWRLSPADDVVYVYGKPEEEELRFCPGSGAPRRLRAPRRVRCECGEMAGAYLVEWTEPMERWTQVGGSRPPPGRRWWWEGWRLDGRPVPPDAPRLVDLPWTAPPNFLLESHCPEDGLLVPVTLGQLDVAGWRMHYRDGNPRPLEIVLPRSRYPPPAETGRVG